MGGGGLRDGAAAPPTLQNSAKDQVSHRHLKYRKPTETEVDEFAEFFDEDNKEIEYNEQLGMGDSQEPDGQFITGTQEPEEDVDNSEHESATLEEESESDDEAALLAELEKIRAERAAMKASEKQSNSPQQSQSSVQENMFVSRGWDEEGVIFRKRTNRNQSQEKAKEFINDTVRSGYHQSFINRYVK
jgi:protein CWC15